MTGCVVMASGESRRFGEGCNKLLANFRGRPLIARALEIIAGLPVETRVVTRDEGVSSVAREMGYRVLLHSLPDISDTIRIGLSELMAAEGCVFIVGDQPLLTRESLSRLIGAFESDKSRICRLSHAGNPGNPVIFPKALFPELASLAPGQSGGAVIARHEGLVTLVEASHESELWDADTPEDIARMTKFKGGGGV